MGRRLHELLGRSNFSSSVTFSLLCGKTVLQIGNQNYRWIQYYKGKALQSLGRSRSRLWAD
jgi:hypothetical protein